MAGEKMLVVDDEDGVRTSLEGILRDEGFRVDGVAGGEAALAALQEDSYQAVFLDVWMPGLDGMQVLERVAGQDQVGVPTCRH